MYQYKEKLLSGGHSTNFARVLAREMTKLTEIKRTENDEGKDVRVYCLRLPAEVNTETFDPAVAGVYKEGCVYDFYLSYVSAIGGWPASRAVEVKTVLEKHPKWPNAVGSVTPLATEIQADACPGWEHGYQEGEPGQSWLFGLRRHMSKCSADGSACGGVGSFIWSPTDDIWVQLIDIQSVVGSGIPLDNLESFLETDTNDTLFDSKTCIAYQVDKDSIGWLPYGKIPLITYFNPDTKGNELAFTQVTPVYMKDAMGKLPMGVQTAIARWNTVWLQTQAKSIYTRRLAQNEKFFKECGIMYV